MATIKPWGSASSDGWEFEGSMWKPWGGSSSDGWEVDGDIPVPVAAIVIMGLVAE